MQIDDSNIGSAMDLLAAGFSNRTPAFWEEGIARLQSAPKHRDGTNPIGYLLKSGGKPVGIGLTAFSDIVMHCEATGNRAVSNHPRINLASWYVEADHRWKMPLLLREMMADKNAIYTDLTPTVGVRPLLTTLGFKRINNGIKIINTAVGAVRYRDTYTVRNWTPGATASPDDPVATLMRDHVALGCLAFEIVTDTNAVPILIKPCKLKMASAVQVIYCADSDRLQGALGSLSRKLLARGHLALIMDIEVNETASTSISQVVLTDRRQRFVKNTSLSGRTDYTYSELIYFDL